MTTQTLTLADFILARIAEDEARAKAAREPFALGDRTGMAEFRVLHPQVAQHVNRWTPARVLADCRARRLIVEEAERAREAANSMRETFCGDDSTRARVERASYAAAACAWRTTLDILALDYVDHPDFREEWQI